jgi:hypothetical protein
VYTHVAKNICNEDSNRVQDEQPCLLHWQENGRYRICSSHSYDYEEFYFWDITPSSLLDFHRTTRRFVLEDRTLKNEIYFITCIRAISVRFLAGKNFCFLRMQFIYITSEVF